MDVRRFQVVLPLSLLACLAALRTADLHAFEEIRCRVFDAFQALRPRPYESTPVRIVDIDDESMNRLGQWPWPRTLVAQLVRRLSDLGASSIAFDMVFPEPDRMSPPRISALWPQIPELKALKLLPDNDAVLARAIAGARVVTGFVLSDKQNSAVPEVKAGFSYGGDGPIAYLERYFSGAVVNLPVIEKAASGNGCFNTLQDRDGVIRRVPLLFRLGRNVYPTLAAEAVRVAQGATGYAVKSSGASGEMAFGQHTGIVKVKIGAYAVPTDERGRVWVYYTRAVPQRIIPVWRVLGKDFPAKALAGSIVFIGTTAAGLKDQRATPLDPTAPGVEVHAQLAEQILLQRFIERPDWADGLEIVYVLLFGLGLIFLLPRLGVAPCAAIAVLAMIAAVAASWHAYAAWNWLLDPVFPSITVLLVYLSSSLISYLESEAEKRQVRVQFSRYMSPVFVDELARHPERLKLGGELKEMTLLFADIRGFTTISERFDPRGLTQFINRYFTPMTDIILENRGTIDKYIGDCIMAFWNAPLDDTGHAAHACRAALAMREELKRLNRQLREEVKAESTGFVPVEFGVGINTGACCVGNMGSEHQFNYSALGDEVNLASRLEGQSETYGVDILIGPKTHEQAAEFATLELDLIRVKGKTKPVRIFALLGDAALKAGEAFLSLNRAQEEMLRAYRSREFGRARGLLDECRARSPGLGLDLFYALYAQRIEACEAAPPGEDWDGVFVATTK